jgi:hypothetical protein
VGLKGAFVQRPLPCSSDADVLVDHWVFGYALSRHFVFPCHNADLYCIGKLYVTSCISTDDICVELCANGEDYHGILRRQREIPAS